MSATKLAKAIQSNGSFLCVGLDTDPNKIPAFLKSNKDGVLEFNKAIIRTTAPYCCAYKLNFAFYENMGADGYDILKQTLNAIPNTHYTIADAKRGDIGNTAAQYAAAIFGDLNFDSVTLAPYMGIDAIQPFLAHENKGIIILALTSNPSGADFQLLKLEDGDYLFEKVLKISKTWSDDERLMYVVGATKPAYLSRIRQIIPSHFLLIPGVGSQGGSLEKVCENALTNRVGLLINSSRGIIYASSGKDFAEAAAAKAKALTDQMKKYLVD